MGWQKDLPYGAELHQAIREDDCIGVLDALKKSYDWIQKNFADRFSTDEVWAIQYNLDEIKNDIINGYLDDEEFDDAVNDELDLLYNICDNLRVWIPAD